MDKLLTIVVPVYKVEPYINKCLDSCLIYKTNEQGEKVLDEELMNQLEVIIVNDGTPDRSAEMSREYVKRYPQTFRQIDKENGGHGSAWNVGLKEATGKYLRFLDSDDWLTNLDVFMHDLNYCNTDVVLNSYDTHYVVKNKVVKTPPKPVEFRKQEPLSESMWGASEFGSQNVNFWTATYKADILKPLYPLFAEKVMYDDCILTWVPLIYGRTYKAFDYVLYNYLIGRPNQSMSVSVQKKRAKSYWKCFEQYEKVRALVKEDDVPCELLTVMDAFISDYAYYVFGFMVFLPFNESKQKSKYLYKKYSLGNRSTRLMKRYKMPFVIYYLLEHLRSIKNRKSE